MDGADLVLLYDYYGDLLTDRQKECFELRYYQDLSLGEIGQELGISRQGVYDNLSRAEALLRNMEQKTGCVSRDRRCRQAAGNIAALARQMRQGSTQELQEYARKILAELDGLEE